MSGLLRLYTVQTADGVYINISDSVNDAGK